METLISNFTLNQKVKDDVFDVDLIAQYILSLQLGNDSFRFCVVDSVFKKCLWLEDYNFQPVFSAEQTINQLEQIYDEHQVLRAGFWKDIRLSFRNQNFTLVPNVLFKSQNASDYLKVSNGHYIPDKDVFYHHHASDGFVNVFKADHKVLEWFNSAYSSRDIHPLHQNSSFIEGVIQQKLSFNERAMFISIEKNYITIVIRQEKQIEFCNTFTYQNEQDFVYYVMLVMDGLQLNPDECKVILLGEIVDKSPVFSNLFKYVRNISLGNRPTHLRFSYRFDEVLEQRYFDLYNIYLCE